MNAIKRVTVSHHLTQQLLFDLFCALAKEPASWHNLESLIRTSRSFTGRSNARSLFILRDTKSLNNLSHLSASLIVKFLLIVGRKFFIINKQELRWCSYCRNALEVSYFNCLLPFTLLNENLADFGVKKRTKFRFGSVIKSMIQSV